MAAAIANQRDSAQGEVAISSLNNNEVIVALLQTVNHLSRWLTPVHEWRLLEYSTRRAQPSVKDVLLRMRQTETWVYGYLYAMAAQSNPDLDLLEEPSPAPMQEEADRRAGPLVVMSEFRRLRQSSVSLLRALPDNAWDRDGYSRRSRNWTIRQLAEYLVERDRDHLREIDALLAQSGARDGIAPVSRVRFDEIDDPFPA
mgnify:CR=1 FL=1